MVMLKNFLTVVVSVCFMLSATAQNDKPCCDIYPKTIKVSGSAELEIVPDEIYVEVRLQEFKKRGEEKTELDVIKSKFIALCHSISIHDSAISVSDYTGFNNSYYYRKSKRQNPEMFASVRYLIKFKDMVKINELADKLDDDAVQRFDIMQVSHSRIQEFRKALKIEAVKAAKEKAIYLAEAIGEKLWEAITITEPEESGAFREQGYASNVAMPVSQMRMRADGDGDVDGINYKKLKLRYEVDVVFALK